MRTTKRFFLIVVIPVVMTFALSFALVPDQHAYAKGTKKSSQEARSNDSGKKKKNDSRSENSSQSRSGSENDKRGSSGSAKGKASSRDSDDRSKGIRITDPRSLTSPRNPANKAGTPTTKGQYRKDYEDIGRIWKERHERRDTRSADRRREHNSYQGNNFNFFLGYSFPGHYRHYLYDYAPGHAYPSIYCYYYGIFPPYISYLRVFYIRPGIGIYYTYTDLPIAIIQFSTSPYVEYRLDRDQRALSSALRDIRDAWKYGDIDLLMDHVRRGSRIHVYLRGEYEYSVDWQDYYDMTWDALSAIRTSSFEFYRVRKRSSGEAIAYGKHVYYDDDRTDRHYNYDDRADRYYYYYPRSRQTVYVSYALERFGGDWYIDEVDSSPYPLD